MVKNLLTPSEFAGRTVGLPWVRWRSDWQACDCFGLLVLYHREVLGIDLGTVPQVDIESGASAVMKDWPECEPEPGATCWMAWQDDAPAHCGILLAGARVLHAQGDAERGGSTRISRLSLIRKLYADVRFHRYSPC